MTGWRLGYGVFPEPLLEPINNMFVNAHTCVPLFVQDAGTAALTGPQDFIVTMRKEYQARRNLVVEALNAVPGISCPTPAGAFYAMPTIAGLGAAGSREFANALLEAGVALLPGTDFGEYGEGYLRISYATAREQLIEALKRIQKVSEDWRN
jgi:aspartate/methionine/tyrosine aminotransferase